MNAANEDQLGRKDNDTMMMTRLREMDCGDQKDTRRGDDHAMMQ